MALIVEDGTGVIGANSNAPLDFADQYLSDRGRITENNWQGSSTDVKQAALIAATDYIEQRWGLLFKGIKEFRGFLLARGTLTFTQQPADTETIDIGAETYTFNTALGGANSILIGDSTAESIANLVAATVASTALAGTSFGVGTTANADATAIDALDNRILVQSALTGTAGNDVTVSSTVTGATWSSATLLGGSDAGNSQSLSFPRCHLYDRAGVLVQGMPEKLKAATVEYGVRSLAASLLPDPLSDDTGRAVIRKLERVGPIWEDTRYEEGSGTSQMLKAFPAADRLLSEYLLPTGTVIR